jgi:chaperonin GroES
MALNIKPPDRVLIEPVAAENKTASGILFQTAKENHKKGTVVAVGNGTKEHTMTKNWRFCSLRKICWN